MGKKESLLKIQQLIDELNRLEAKIADDPNFKKWERRASRYLSNIFGETSEQLISFGDIRFEYDSLYEFDTDKKDFINGKNEVIALFESFMEEINEWELSEREHYVKELQEISDTSVIEDILNEFQRFGPNPQYKKWKYKAERTLEHICGTESKYLKDFKTIRFLDTGYRPMDGLEVPADKKTFENGIITAKTIFESILEEVHKGLYDNKEENIITTSTQQSIEHHKTKVFIVHGHDDAAKQEVARFIEKLGLEAIILHEQVSSSMTIIEKIEYYTSQANFGIVIYSACDIGGKDKEHLENRARQNVVFEHGYLIGRLGRNSVCPLVKGNIETPGDIGGIVYIPMLAESWHLPLAKELKASGYNVDLNKLV